MMASTLRLRDAHTRGSRGNSGKPLERADEVEVSGEDEALVEGHDDRLWLVQCKRERAIGPLKLVNYLEDTFLAPRREVARHRVHRCL